jgi:hypothetical protein
MNIEILRQTAREVLPSKQQDWLDRALKMLRYDFDQIGMLLPRYIDILVNYPRCAIGYSWLGTCRCCWSGDDDDDDAFHTIFINPTVNGLLALDILVHELVHAVTKDGHGDKFMEAAAAIGLDDTGPTAGAEEILLKRLKDIQMELGPYPLVTDCLEEA